MLKTLLKKQFMESFKNYFYNPKTSQKRSKISTIVWFAFFSILIVSVLGGIFTYLSISICKSLIVANMDWLYFLLISGISIIIGTFGSVFNTFSSLYKAKDNDLLLSMPIPIKTIIFARLINVYLMGTIYSSMVIIPAIIVYWCIEGLTISKIICDIFLLLIITFFVFILSCLLGWIIAKVSIKIKNKSFVSVFISLIFIGLYYFVYFKAQELIQDLVINAAIYGEKIKGFSYGLYFFGKIGEGNLLSTLCFTLITCILLLLTWIILKNTFLSITTSNNIISRKNINTTKEVKQKGIFKALLLKEFSKFISSPSFMLNCGLGIIFIPIFGIIMLIKGNEFLLTFQAMFNHSIMGEIIILCAILCTLVSMNDIAAPSISLEGKSIWIIQSLPLKPKKIFHAKTMMHFILTIIPMIFTLICTLISLSIDIEIKLIICLTVISFTIFSAIFSTYIGIKMPILSWTNEIIPIKQSGSVVLSLLGGWAITAIFAVLYFLIGYHLGIIIYLLLWSIAFIIASIILQYYLDNKGSEKLSKL